MENEIKGQKNFEKFRGGINMVINENDLYTVKETAEALKCGIGTIYKLVKDKKLKALKIGFIKITGQSIIELKNGDPWVA